MTRLAGRRTDIAAIVVLFGLVAAMLAPVVFRGQVLLPVDLRDQWQPWHAELRPEATTPHNRLMSDTLWEAYPMAVQSQRLWRSGLPFWDPTAMTGMAAWATGKMYSNPVYVTLAFGLSPERAMSWSAVIHLLIAGLGMYLLLREIGTGTTAALIGASAFAFNGYLIVWLSLTYFVGTMVWTPLLFFCIERALRRHEARWLAGAAGVFAVQILAGFVLFAAHSGLLVALVYGLRAGERCWRKRSLTIGVQPAMYGALAIVGGVALAAFQFLPTVELFQLTGRSERQFSEVLPPHEMVRLVVPGIAGTPLDGEAYKGAINYSEATLYFGVIPLICMLAALFGTAGSRRRAALVFFGIGLVFWLAVYGLAPFYQTVQTITPGFRATFAGRVFFIVAFCWSVVAGLGADALLRPSTGRNRGWWAALALAGALLAILRYLESWWTTEDFPLVYPNNIGMATIYLLVGGAAVLLLRVPRVPRRAIGLTLLALTATDLLSTHAKWNTTSAPGSVLPLTPNLKRLTQSRPHEDPTLPKRIAAIHGARMLPGMSAQAYGLSNVGGYSSWIMERYSRYMTLTRKRAKPYQMNRISLGLCCGPLLDALAVDWVYAAPNIQRLDLEGLLLDQLDDARQAGTSSPTALRLRLDGRARRSLILAAPDRISFPLDPTTPQRLTAAIGLDWNRCPATDGVRFKVRVQARDGQDSVRFDHLMVPRYSEPPAWVEEVEMYFRPTSFVVGSVISASTLAALIGLLLIDQRRRRQGPVSKARLSKIGWNCVPSGLV